MRPDEIGPEIRRLRLERGWSLADLARRAGTSPPTVHRYESGWRRFEVATLGKLAAALGCLLDVRFLEPGRTPRGQRIRRRVPRRLRRLFWDRNLRPSDAERYPAWVVRRVLDLGSLDDVQALVRYYGRDRFLDVVSGLRFESPRTRAFWEAMARLEGRKCTPRFSRTEADGCWMS
ncbi:MAG: helix-turn-helix domain-containing protein [Candidatus Eiseniibacteriota bacterium]